MSRRVLPMCDAAIPQRPLGAASRHVTARAMAVAQRPGAGDGALPSVAAAIPAAAQVGAPHGRIVAQPLRGALADNAAVLQEVPAVGNGQRLTGVLLHQQHAHAHVLDAAERLEQLAADQRREAERRLVQQQDVGRRHQRPADGHHLPLAAAHGVGGLPHALGEPGEQRNDPLEVLRGAAAGPGREGAELEVVVHRQVGEDAAVLRHQRQPGLDHPVRRQRSQVDLTEGDARARQMRDHAAHGLEAGRLAGAVGPQHDDDLALAHAQRHAVDGQVLAVADGKLLNLKHSRPLGNAEAHGCRPAARSMRTPPEVPCQRVSPDGHNQLRRNGGQPPCARSAEVISADLGPNRLKASAGLFFAPVA